MSLDELLATLRARDVRLWLEGDALRFSAPVGALDEPLRASLRAHKPALMITLRAAIEPLSPIPARPDPGQWPLTSEQTRIWLSEQLTPGTTAYNMTLALHVRGATPGKFAAAVAASVGRHEVLRTVVRAVDGVPVQVRSDADPSVVHEDLRHLSSASREELVATRARAEAGRPFVLADETPLRVHVMQREDAAFTAIATLHHIAGDARSLELLVQAWMLALADGAAPVGGTRDFGDVAVWLRTRASTPTMTRHIAAWCERLRDAPGLTLPLDPPVTGHGEAPGVGRVALRIAPATARALESMARARSASGFAAYAAVFMVLLSRWTGQDEVVLATPLSLRDRPDLDDVLGCLIQTALLRGRIAVAGTFAGLLEQVRDNIRFALEHREVALEQIAAGLQGTGTASVPELLRVLIAMQPELPVLAPAPGVSVVLEEVPGPAPKLDLVCLLRPRDGAIEGVLEFDRGRLAETTVEALARALEVLCVAIAAEPDAAIGALPLLGPAARTRALAAAHGPPAPAFTGSIVDLVMAQAAHNPDRIAIAGPDFNLSYRTCIERAGRAARWLRDAGVGPETRVAVGLERGPELVPCLLGVMMAGAAYVPLEPRDPPARRRALLERAGAGCWLLARDDVGPAPPGVRVAIVGTAPPWSTTPALPRPVEVDPEQLAYVIFTSGSTGTPKGVAVTHRAAAARIAWAGIMHDEAALAGVLFASSLVFDLSMFELFAPLCTGGTVVLAQDILELPTLPNRGRVTLVDTVPSALAALLAGPGLPDSLRVLQLAGEALTPDLVDAALARAPTCRVYNLYGPAEDTTYTTCGRQRPGAAVAPIGAPLPGSRVHVLDARGEPVPETFAGEAWIGGVGLARGYDAQPAATAERFVPDPHATRPGARLYRTGDRLRRRGEALCFVGRVDRQVKLLGVRVELGEVEAALRTIAGVEDAAVVFVGGRPPAPDRLLAYVVGTGLEPGRLRASLAEVLPRAYLPGACVVVERLPRTASGKLDHGALTALSVANPAASQRTATPTETRVAEIWAELLGVDAVASDADFFALGGSSLQALRIVARVREVFAVELAPRAALAARTVPTLAREIDAALARHAEALAALLAEVEGMTDEEVRRRLAALAG